jgi:hypothetical protein
MQGLDLRSGTIPGKVLVDVAWALASSRHWTHRLGGLSVALSKAGGVGALEIKSVATALWAFAVLNYVPHALLDKPWGKLEARGTLVSPFWGTSLQPLARTCVTYCPWHVRCHTSSAMKTLLSKEGG